MNIVTLLRSVNGVFTSKLPNVLNNVSQVGLVEFAYDKVVSADYTQTDLVAYFEYNAELDDITTFGDSDLTFTKLLEYQLKITKEDSPRYEPPPGEIRNDPPSDKIIYSSLKYYIGETDVPSITGVMYQADGDSNKDREIVDFTNFFNSAVLSYYDFQKNVTYTKWNDKKLQQSKIRKRKASRIIIKPTGITVNIKDDVPLIELTFNEAAFKLFNLKVDHFKSPNVLTFDHVKKKYEISFCKTYESTADIQEVTFDSLKELMLRNKFESSGTKFTSLIIYLKPDLDAIVKDLVSLYNKFKTALVLDGLPSLSLSVTTNGKLKVGQDLPQCIKLHLSERLCRNLGIHNNILQAGTYKGVITKASIAMSIQSSDLIANDVNKYNELAVIAITDKKIYRPNRINYLPLAINNLTQFSVHVVDYDGDLLNFDGTQSIIVLHFK